MRTGVLVALLASAPFLCSAAQADTFDGTAYFTTYYNTNLAGPTANVYSIGYTYNDATQAFSLGSPHAIALTRGADGILFAPNGNLLVGGQGSGSVYQVVPSTGTSTSASAGGNSFHLTLSQNGQSVYTSNFGGPLATIPLSNFGTANPPTITNITGSEGGLTQIAFGGGKTFYVNGNPNGFGNVGLIDLTTGATTRLVSGLQAAHGIVADSYTGLIDLFGAGDVATIDPTSNAISSSVHFAGAPGDFDQGAPDGYGHALIAGSDGLTFIDYRASRDILHPDYVTFIGGLGGIDDIAPLSGLGSAPVPGPIPGAGLAGLVALALAGVRARARRA